jgi:hypothetical protein
VTGRPPWGTTGSVVVGAGVVGAGVVGGVGPDDDTVGASAHPAVASG